MSRLGYWERRTSRRYILRGGATAGVGLAALAAFGCGSDDEKDQTETFSRLAKQEDSSKSAKKGGVLTHFVVGDETSLDALASARGAGFGGPAAPAYSRLIRDEETFGQPEKAKIVGDIAESWEISDQTTITFKLRQAKFDPRPPVNGRVVTADDVVFSAEKMQKSSPYSSQLFYSSDPASPVESVRKIDDRTVQMKLAFPWAPILPTLAHGNLLIEPVEADGGFNVRTETRGTGAWMLESYTPAQSFKWRRNPNWYGLKDFPYLDGYDEPVITEYAARLAQFRAKNLDVFTPPSTAEGSNAADIIAMLNEAPDLRLYEGLLDSGITSIAFGSRPGSPFADPRVRQAMSMSLDREILAETESGADLYQKAGIPFPFDLDSHLAASWQVGDLWIDPRSTKDWGDAGKYWKLDIAEAKKLMSAAGHANGLEFPINLASRTHSSPQQANVLAEMMAQVGLKGTIRVVDYNLEFLPKIWVPGAVKGDFDGMTMGNTGDWQAHVGSSLYISAHSKGSYTTGRNWTDGGQAKIDRMIEGTLKEFDENKLRDEVKTVQKELASYMSGIPYTYAHKPYHVAWPWVQNYLSFRSARTAVTTYQWLHVWIDESKKTS